MDDILTLGVHKLDGPYLANFVVVVVVVVVVI